MAEEKTAKSKGNIARTVVIAAIAIVAVLVGAGVWAYASGVIYPMNAAAKYGTFDYLDESEVTEYITTYQKQMGYADAPNGEWAEFLATYNLTPERLRLSTISQILSDKAVEKRCAELGITATDEEVTAAVRQLKNVYGIGGDDAWAATLKMYGQSEEGLRNVYRLSIMKDKLCDAEVPMPTPTDDDVRSYVSEFAASRLSAEMSQASSSEEAARISASSTDTLLRHSYCFALKAAGNEPSLDESNRVELVRQEFLETGADLEGFVTLLKLYSNDEELVSKNGAMGWDADGSDYSEAYSRALGTLSSAGVSSVFTDGDRVCFIWVDQTYAIPYAESELKALNLDAMPQSLKGYFTDCAAYGLWEKASQDYLGQLVSNMDVTVYPMPANVPYNVDMSAYLVTDSSAK